MQSSRSKNDQRMYTCTDDHCNFEGYLAKIMPIKIKSMSLDSESYETSFPIQQYKSAITGRKEQENKKRPSD